MERYLVKFYSSQMLPWTVWDVQEDCEVKSLPSIKDARDYVGYLEGRPSWYAARKAAAHGMPAEEFVTDEMLQDRMDDLCLSFIGAQNESQMVMYSSLYTRCSIEQKRRAKEFAPNGGVVGDELMVGAAWIHSGY